MHPKACSRECVEQAFLYGTENPGAIDQMAPGFSKKKRGKKMKKFNTLYDYIIPGEY